MVLASAAHILRKKKERRHGKLNFTKSNREKAKQFFLIMMR